MGPCEVPISGHDRNAKGGIVLPFSPVQHLWLDLLASAVLTAEKCLDGVRRRASRVL